MIAIGFGTEYAAPIIGLTIEIPIAKGVCTALCVMELGSVYYNAKKYGKAEDCYRKAICQAL